MVSPVVNVFPLPEFFGPKASDTFPRVIAVGVFTLILAYFVGELVGPRPSRGRKILITVCVQHIVLSTYKLAKSEFLVFCHAVS